MEKVKAFLKRKNIVFSAKRYGIDALGAMAQGLFCSLLDMGLIPHTRVTLQKVAPMGDPIEIRVRGYELTLRVEEAQKIEVEDEPK